MAVDAFYFSHDSNAKDDPKCVLLIEQLGLEGYGILWVLIETLRDQPGYRYPLALIPAISRRYNTTAEKMKTVIGNYGLFEIDDKDFFSLSLIKRMEHFEYKREIARRAGKESARKRMLNAGSTDVQPTFNGGSTSKSNKTKSNKTKVKDKKLFGEKVLLTEQEYQKLVNQHGESETKQMIDILDNWYLTKGKKPNASDYHTMVGKGWVLKRFNEDQEKLRNKPTGDTRLGITRVTTPEELGARRPDW